MSDKKGQAISLWKRLTGGEKLISIPSSNQAADQKGLGKAFKNLGASVRISKDPDGNKLWVKEK